jgi:hypothetical protein
MTGRWFSEALPLWYLTGAGVVFGLAGQSLSGGKPWPPLAGSDEWNNRRRVRGVILA